MTSSNRLNISNPASGLLVYDTTTRSFWYYDVGWRELVNDKDWTEGSGILYNTTDNVGIGTASPSEKLEVRGKIKINAGSSSSIIIDEDEIKSNGGINHLSLNSTAGVTNICGGGIGARYINLLNQDDDSQLRIGKIVTSDAMVRIAKNSFIEKPHLELFETGDANGYANLSFKSSGGTSSDAFWLLRGRTTSPFFAFYYHDGTTGKTIAEIDGANQQFQHYTSVGINQSNPSDWLHISAADDEDAFRVQVGGTTRLRVHGNGGVSVGYNPGSPVYALELANDATPLIGRGRANAWITYSDRRIKRNFKTLDYGLAEIMSLKPQKYEQHASLFTEAGKLELKEEKEATLGFVAQELFDIIPEAVHQPADESKDLWAVNYEKIIPVLTKAIQEQQEIIVEMQKKIADLEGKNNLVQKD
jgi:hypothetical protein